MLDTRLLIITTSDTDMTTMPIAGKTQDKICYIKIDLINFLNTIPIQLRIFHLIQYISISLLFWAHMAARL